MIIPHSNIQNLMLNSEVTQAIEKGSFTIWPVKHVSEAIELLMDSPVESESSDGIYTIIRSKFTS